MKQTVYDLHKMECRRAQGQDGSRSLRLVAQIRLIHQQANVQTWELEKKRGRDGRNNENTSTV